MPEASWDEVDEVICNQELVHQARGVYGVDLKCAGTQPADVLAVGPPTTRETAAEEGGIAGYERGAPRDQACDRRRLPTHGTRRGHGSVPGPHYLTTNYCISSVVRLLQ